MSSVSSRTPFDFFKLKEIDKKEDKYDETVITVFEENGLYRKKLPKGTDSLMRAVSEALYFTSNHAAEIQQSIIKYLTQLIASGKLNSRLSSFQGNSLLLKDFCNNPRLTGFEKTNLELVSSLFKVRVILYTMNEDHYLTATIFNNNYPNTIELLRTKASHYDPVFPKSFIKKAGICQNLILNLIDRAVNNNRTSTQYKDINNDEYVNITFESAQAADSSPKSNSPLDQFRITRGHHKKSLSDNFNTNFEIMEEQQMKFFDAFLNAGPPDDLLKTFGGNNRKDTAESNFSINANFDFIDDQNLDQPFEGGKEFTIKNYPISSGGLSPRAPVGLELDSPMPTFSKAKFGSHLFNENLTLAEIERLEKTANTATTIDPKQLGASPFYRNASPPGLSPAKFSQRTFTDTVQTPKSDLFSPSPSLPNNNTMQPLSPAYPYNSASPIMKRNVSSPYVNDFNGQRQYGEAQVNAFAPQSQTLSSQSPTFTLQPQTLNSMYMKRVGSVGASMSMQAGQPQQDSFGMGQYDQSMGGYGQYDQTGEYDNSYDQFGQAPREKKKPIILDESKDRYLGRLKFFDENKKYGFIVMDDDGSDIFVHYDDLIKAGINKELLRTARMGNLIRLSFGCMAYIGKYNRSRKAIDIVLLQ